MNLNDIPQDSVLRDWCTYLTTTEIPFTYQVAAGLSLLGVVVRRNRWVDQFEWRVYPNQSVLFIGPSGIGKDTIINRVQRSLDKVEWLSKVPTIGGTTFENITARLAELTKPAAAFIPAAEMTAFFGKADYQANMLTGMTNLLSNGERIDITTKGGMFRREERQDGTTVFKKGEPKYIWEPTITMHAGSTVEWLHKSMPEGTLEGGFLGRFLIVIEEFGSRFIPLVKRDKTRAELVEIGGRLDKWNSHLEELVKDCQKPREVIIFEDAENLYVNWYHNRFKQFSKAVMPYANRSRDMVLRLAMLMAFSRKHHRYIEMEDVEFAIRLISDVAKNIDDVVLPPSKEAQVAQKILEYLPAGTGEIYFHLAKRYSTRDIDAALTMLRMTGQVVTTKDGKICPTEPEQAPPTKEF